MSFSVTLATAAAEPSRVLLLSDPRTGYCSIRFEDCSADSRGQLDHAQCKAQGGCGWTTHAGFSLSIFGPNITGSVDVTNFSSIGGLGPALQMGAKGASSAFATFKDCRFENSALSGNSTVAPSPVVSLAPDAKGRAIYGDYPKGGVLFENVTISLGPEEPGYLKHGHHRAWLLVESDDGLKNINLSATVVAKLGSGGCKMAKVERAEAKGPWEAVDLNFTCRDTAAPAR